MAAIARGRGEPEHVVRAWLARALAAPRDEGAEMAIGHSAMLPLLIDMGEPQRANGASPAHGGPADPRPETVDDRHDEVEEATVIAPGPAVDDYGEAEPPRRDFEGLENEGAAGAKPAA